MNALDELRVRYIEEQPRYKQLAEEVRARLESETRAEGLNVRVEHRAKDVPSLVKKALAHGKSYQDIVDKAGVRVIYHYAWQGQRIEEIIDSAFVVLKREDKAADRPPDQLGYLGVHYDVRFKDGDKSASKIELDRPTCEIQLHTRQENTWADYSHELLYKAPQDIPTGIRRDLYRLVALVELYDREVNRVRDVILAQPGHAVARILDRLERDFYRLAAREYDGELSRRILDAVLPLYGDNVDATIEAFLNGAGSKLDQIYTMYVDDQRASPLLFQPEALVLFDLLERSPTALQEAFSDVAPVELLADLATVWGTPLT
ncbi:MAG: RelA/SpoT domain-containing protein [Actinomycetota bacterium]